MASVHAMELHGPHLSCDACQNVVAGSDLVDEPKKPKAVSQGAVACMSTAHVRGGVGLEPGDKPHNQEVVPGCGGLGAPVGQQREPGRLQRGEVKACLSDDELNIICGSFQQQVPRSWVR